jgi:hypothetical protein
MNRTKRTTETGYKLVGTKDIFLRFDLFAHFLSRKIMTQFFLKYCAKKKEVKVYYFVVGPLFPRTRTWRKIWLRSRGGQNIVTLNA